MMTRMMETVLNRSVMHNRASEEGVRGVAEASTAQREGTPEGAGTRTPRCQCPVCRWAAAAISHDAGRPPRPRAGAAAPSGRGNAAPAGGQASARPAPPQGEFTLQLPVLRELCAMAPVRCTKAALIFVLQKAGGLHLGAAPVLPWPPDPAETDGGAAAPPAGLHTPVPGDPREAGGGPARRVRFERLPSEDGGGAQEGQRGPAGGVRDGGKEEDREMVEFALSQSLRFPPLHRWMLLQLATNPCLAHVRHVAQSSPAGMRVPGAPPSACPSFAIFCEAPSIFSRAIIVCF